MAAFVLGNGVSRQAISVDQLMGRGSVYGCNALYRTHSPTVLVATDRGIAEEIQRSGYAQNNRFYTRRPLPGLGAATIERPYFGFSSGPVAMSIAARDGHHRIYLLGFDMGPVEGKFNNIYADTEFYKPSAAEPTYTGNWTRQICQVCRDFPDRSFVRVHGETTAEVKELMAVRNISVLDISDFLQRLNTPEDL